MLKSKDWLVLGSLLFMMLLMMQQSTSTDMDATGDQWIASFFDQQRATATLMGGGGSSSGFVLTVPSQQPVPPDQDVTPWQAATGTLDITTSGTEAIAVVHFEATGLVPDGLYSLWWVLPTESLVLEDNARLLVFRADEKGMASATFSIFASEDYAVLGVAAVYHASSSLNGDQQRTLGNGSFLHLTSANLVSLIAAARAG